jgi:hypothetical protein
MRSMSGRVAVDVRPEGSRLCGYWQVTPKLKTMSAGESIVTDAGDAGNRKIPEAWEKLGANAVSAEA